jgi:hypothetical protein
VNRSRRHLENALAFGPNRSEPEGREILDEMNHFSIGVEVNDIDGKNRPNRMDTLRRHNPDTSVIPRRPFLHQLFPAVEGAVSKVDAHAEKGLACFVIDAEFSFHVAHGSSLAALTLSRSSPSCRALHPCVPASRYLVARASDPAITAARPWSRANRRPAFLIATRTCSSANPFAPTLDQEH